jgi:hypothetical protein
MSCLTALAGSHLACLSLEGSVNAVLGAPEQPPYPKEISDVLVVQPESPISSRASLRSAEAFRPPR